MDPAGSSLHPLRVLGSVWVHSRFRLCFPLSQVGELGRRWLRARSRLGRAVMQTERHRESCSEGSERILTCRLKALPFPLQAQSSNCCGRSGGRCWGCPEAPIASRGSVQREGELRGQILPRAVER